MSAGTRTRKRFSQGSTNFSLLEEVRSKPPGEPWSNWRWTSGNSGPSPFEPSSSVCVDTVGRFGQDNLLDITHRTVSPGRLEYSWLGEPVELWWNPGSYSQSRGSCSYPLLPLESWEDQDMLTSERIAFATEAAAGVNPSGAKFDAAVFLGEMRDLPSLFQNAGKTLAKGGANEYLKYQYGWKPLIKDLRNFFKVVNDVDKRLRTLERLRKDDKLRLPYRSKNPVRTQGFDSIEHQGYHTTGYWSSRLKSDVSWIRDRWAIVNFVPDLPRNLVSLPSSDQLKLINKALYGGVVDGNTLWQLMPWSWLADWNWNVSSFLESQRNVVGAKVTDVVVMESTSAIVTTDLIDWHDDYSTGFNPPSGSKTPGILNQVSKRRFPRIDPAVTSTGRIDLLQFDSFKTSILTALAIQRFK